MLIILYHIQRKQTRKSCKTAKSFSPLYESLVLKSRTGKQPVNKTTGHKDPANNKTPDHKNPANNKTPDHKNPAH